MPDAEGASVDSPDSGEDDQQAERIVDPDDYNLRRRLKQIHDAKEAVITRKDNALDLERRLNDKEFSASDRDRFIVEKVVDYIMELRPLLAEQERETEFLNQTLAVGGDDDLTVEDIVRDRGRVSDDADREYLRYQASMAAWDICNQYFEEVAGVVFERESARPGQNPVDPASRFNE